MEEISKDRVYVSKLIQRVLSGYLRVRSALAAFPDTDDVSIRAAFHALAHYEADEDLRTDADYKLEQDSYLRFIAETLQVGKDLPENIIKNYNKYYKKKPVKRSGAVKGLINKLCKFLNV